VQTAFGLHNETNINKLNNPTPIAQPNHPTKLVISPVFPLDIDIAKKRRVKPT
jgi:hypothetical protein